MPAESFQAFRAVTDGDSIDRCVATMSVAELPDDGALVEVHWSSVNYKDGLAATPTGKVARISPIVPGIDLAGVLAEDAGDVPAGTQVLAHGYDIGVARHGGFAELARVPADWLLALPDGLSARDAMIVGTAGFTAAMSVQALQDHGVTPDRGPVLVTGATGGVGSTAVGMLDVQIAGMVGLSVRVLVEELAAVVRPAVVPLSLHASPAYTASHPSRQSVEVALRRFARRRSLAGVEHCLGSCEQLTADESLVGRLVRCHPLAHVIPPHAGHVTERDVIDVE